MKIAIDIRPLMDRYYSGVSEYTLSLVSALLNIDKENSYTLFYNSFKDASNRIPKFENVKYLATRYPSKFIDYFTFNFLNRPRIDRLARADVFIVPHINFSGVSKECFSLLTIHDLSFLRFPEFFNWRKNIWHWNLRVRTLVKRFDKIIAVSENTKWDIVELLKVPESKVVVIYPGLNECMLPISDELILSEVREKYHLPERFILYLGTIEPRKNIEGLIKAFEICRARDESLSLVLAGTFGWKSGSIKRAIANSKFKKDIIILGYVDSADKPALYSLAQVFVYPSFYEGFGFPPLEAMASGTPVITSFASSLPEVVGDAGILVDPYDTAEIANAIESVLEDDKLRDSLIERGLIQSAKFDWNKTAGEYLQIVNSKFQNPNVNSISKTK